MKRGAAFSLVHPLINYPALPAEGAKRATSNLCVAFGVAAVRFAEALIWTEVLWSVGDRENVMEGGQADNFAGFRSKSNQYLTRKGMSR